jgi:hypothetical protein
MSDYDPKRTSILLRLVLLQRYRQAAHTEGGRKSDLSSLQLQNYAVRAARYCNPSREGRIGTYDVRRGPKIGGGTNQVRPRHANGTSANAADAQPIALALEGQSAGAAANDEPDLSNFKTYRASRPRFSMSSIIVAPTHLLIYLLLAQADMPIASQRRMSASET